MIPTDRYCHSGPGNGDNSILTKLSVMPFCRGAAVLLSIVASCTLQEGHWSAHACDREHQLLASTFSLFFVFRSCNVLCYVVSSTCSNAEISGTQRTPCMVFSLP